MKRSPGLILLLVICFAFFNSCKKDRATEQYTPGINSTSPDLSAQITTSVSGFITDENNNAVVGAQVTAGTKTTVTDGFGYFEITNASLSKTAGFVKVTQAGYFTGYRTFVAQQGKETFTRLKLIPKTSVGTINGSAGGTASTTDGGTVTLPANAVVIESNGNAYTGTIHVAAHWIDPSSGSELQSTMPGNLMGIDSSGYLKQLTTFGMLAVELTDDAGDLLQIAPGKQATLNFPIPSSLTASAPATIPLWSFNDTTGLWKQESSANKTGNSYVGTVSHFSYWNCDLGSPLVNFTTQIVDSALRPLANVAVSISIDGQPNSARVAYTDTAGFVYGPVPANSNLTLNVLTPCYVSAYAKSFASATSNIDLGAIVASLGQSVITLTGTAINCSNGAVTNGYVQTYNGTNAYNNIRIPITNGSFNYAGLVCADTTTTYIVVDNSTNQQTLPKNITLVPGINNLGNLSACGTNTMETITYTLDGATTSYSQPSDGVDVFIAESEIGGADLGLSTRVEHSTFVSNSDSYTNDCAFLFTGGTFVGNNNDTLYSFGTPTRDLYPVSTVPVNITEYDSTGGFISGSFSGNFRDNNDNNSSHTLSCSFKIVRSK